MPTVACSLMSGRIQSYESYLVWKLTWVQFGVRAWTEIKIWCVKACIIQFILKVVSSLAFKGNCGAGLTMASYTTGYAITLKASLFRLRLDF